MLDYKTNFINIQSNEELKKQEAYFIAFETKLKKFLKQNLSDYQKLRLAQLSYEIKMNLQRISLEKKWNDEGRKVPEKGLHSMSNYKDWYSYYVKHFTSVDIDPAQVFVMGETEVQKVKSEIEKIRMQLGYSDEKTFHIALSADSFYLKDKETILLKYADIDKTVRRNLKNLFFDYSIGEISVMEWPEPGPNTPSGMYSNKFNNPYGKDVFQYNFYGGKHNKRCMHWLYMHEAIPGHHLQSTVRRKTANGLENQFYYFGNAEGWACYIEDRGKDVGLYADPYSYLGKWEWDLVRSARLVMEVGIHYYGWSFDKAKEYWKQNIKGQDEIADREINRITNWAGQALCYKVGALIIKKIVDEKLKNGEDIRKAHELFLNYSDVPLQVLLEACGR